MKKTKDRVTKPSTTVILPREAKEVLGELQTKVFEETGFSVSLSQLIVVLINEALAARGQKTRIPRSSVFRRPTAKK
jgi:hypothetical protein